MSLVTVLVNRSCPHCLRAVDQVEALAGRCGARVAAVDVTAHPELAAHLAVKTSPAVLFPGGHATPGVPDAATFAALAANPSNSTPVNA